MPGSKAEILQGTLEMLILQSLSRAPMHGYGIAQWLEETSEGLLRIEQGSLYPALYRMEERGWISARWDVTELNRRAKFYSLSDRGQERLMEETRGWARLVRAITLVLGPDPGPEERSSPEVAGGGG
jgi:transcriptional regulator